MHYNVGSNVHAKSNMMKDTHHSKLGYLIIPIKLFKCIINSLSNRYFFSAELSIVDTELIEQLSWADKLIFCLKEKSNVCLFSPSAFTET